MEKKVVHLESEHFPSSFMSLRNCLLKIFAKANGQQKDNGRSHQSLLQNNDKKTRTKNTYTKIP